MLIFFVIQYLQLEFQNLEFKTKQSVFSTDSTSNFLKNGIIFLSVLTWKKRPETINIQHMVKVSYHSKYRIMINVKAQHPVKQQADLVVSVSRMMGEVSSVTT